MTLRATVRIARLIQANAQHRKGWRLDEVTPDFVLQQAELELKELQAAPNDPEELADLLAILIHYSIKKGWSQIFLDRLICAKLKQRFTIPETPP